MDNQKGQPVPLLITKNLRTQNVPIVKMTLTSNNTEVKVCFPLYSCINTIQLKRPVGYFSLKYRDRELNITEGSKTETK